METPDKINFKKRLLLHCRAIIQSRIDTALQSMQNAQDAANSEEKSSAGDKYETGRAMNHLEKDMHARQLVANQQELAGLTKVDGNSTYTAIATGSIVVCDDAIFFIAAGIGKVFFEKGLVYALSPSAPLAQSLMNKVAGNSFIFNKKVIVIKDVF